MNSNYFFANNTSTFVSTDLYKTSFKTFDLSLKNIKINSFVKVKLDSITQDFPSGIFWIYVTNMENDKIKRIVNNDLIHTEYHGVKYDDILTFKKDNIFDIMLGE